MKFKNDVLYLIVNCYASGTPVIEKAGVDKKVIWTEYKQRKRHNPNMCIKIVRFNECPEYAGESDFEKDEIAVRDFQNFCGLKQTFTDTTISTIGRKKDNRFFVNVQYDDDPENEKRRMQVVDNKRIDVPASEVIKNIEIAVLYCFDLFMRIHDEIKSEIVLKVNGKEIKRYNKQ